MPQRMAELPTTLVHQVATQLVRPSAASRINRVLVDTPDGLRGGLWQIIPAARNNTAERGAGGVDMLHGAGRKAENRDAQVQGKHNGCSGHGASPVTLTCPPKMR